mgnify:FL=1
MSSPMQSIHPMLLKSATIPPDTGDYSFEVKWDGFRAIIYLDRGRLKIRSRSLRDMTVEYPTLLALADSMRKRRLILDGEIVALGASGKPDFGRMQQRSGKPASIVFIAFDVLYRDDRCLLNHPYPCMLTLRF